jgi:excisionase family DNA binding protein
MTIFNEFNRGGSESLPLISKPVSTAASTKGSRAQEDLLTADELAKRLGLKRRGVQSMTARRILPVIRLSGRCLRYRWSDVEKALANRTQRATE